MRALLVCCVLVLAGCAGLPAVERPTPAAEQTVSVVEVVDGDTVDIRYKNGSEDTVRLLGVDTPETQARQDPEEYGVPNTSEGRACLERAGENATAFARSYLAGSTATIRTDPLADRRGSYGRLLAYVEEPTRNRSLNYALLEAGHARLFDTEFRQRDRFAAAEERAKAANRGLWRCR